MGKKPYLGWGILAILVVLGLLFLSGYKFRYPAAIGGATVTAVSKIDFISNDPEFQKEAFLITVVMDEGAESLVVNVDPQDFYENTGMMTNGTIRIMFDLENASCRYE
ncbi:MAG: hypothetical protein DRP11_05145, partial [Candidatus Aenigmatarchaeota archaeon]